MSFKQTQVALTRINRGPGRWPDETESPRPRSSGYWARMFAAFTTCP